MENRFKDNRDNDYSFFLNQLKFNVELGNLDSFLLGIGIENAGEFFEICQFALKGDKEAFYIYYCWVTAKQRRRLPAKHISIGIAGLQDCSCSCS